MTIELKSEHLWPLVDDFTVNDPNREDKMDGVSVPDFVARAMLHDLRALQARVAALEYVNSELTARIAELESNQRKPASNQYAGVRGGLIKGRIRTKGTPRVPGGPSELRPGFYDAVRQATVDDLMWALTLLIKHPQARRTHRTERIQCIDKRLREISQQGQEELPK